MEKLSLFQRIIRIRIVIMFFLLLILIIAFAILATPNNSVVEVFEGKSIFLQLKIVTRIIDAMPLTMLLTTGITLLMISGKLDLSTGANGTMCAMLLAYVVRDGMPLVPAIFLALVIGVLIGFINAALVNELRVAPFIGTLATSSIATGFTYFIANRRAIDVVHPFMKQFGRMMLWGYVPVATIFAAVLMIIAGIVLHRTRLGRIIYIAGGNPQAAMLSGINHKKVSYILFMICGLFSAIAGIVFIARQQSASMTGITAARFEGITAAVLGGIAFGGGSGGMAGAFVGLVVLNTFNTGLTIVGLNPAIQRIATGLLLIFALTLDFLQKQQNEKIVAS